MSKSKGALSKAADVDKIAELADVFGALSHPHRLSIFLRLASKCRPNQSVTEFEARACVSDAGAGLDISASTLSHHIKELRNAGLIKMAKSGQKTDCWVESATIEKLKTFFASVGCSK